VQVSVKVQLIDLGHHGKVEAHCQLPLGERTVQVPRDRGEQVLELIASHVEGLGRLDVTASIELVQVLEQLYVCLQEAIALFVPIPLVSPLLASRVLELVRR